MERRRRKEARDRNLMEEARVLVSWSWSWLAERRCLRGGGRTGERRQSEGGLSGCKGLKRLKGVETEGRKQQHKKNLNRLCG